MKNYQINLVLFFAGLLSSVAFAFVANMTYHDLQEERRTYCEMVASEAWPDYKGIFEKECHEWLTHYADQVE